MLERIDTTMANDSAVEECSLAHVRGGGWAGLGLDIAQGNEIRGFVGSE